VAQKPQTPFCVTPLIMSAVIQVCNGSSDSVSGDQRPSSQNGRQRVRVSTRQEPSVRGGDGVRRSSRAVHNHRRLLCRRVLRDTSSHQDSASEFWPHFVCTSWSQDSASTRLPHSFSSTALSEELASKPHCIVSTHPEHSPHSGSSLISLASSSSLSRYSSASRLGLNLSRSE